MTFTRLSVSLFLIGFTGQARGQAPVRLELVRCAAASDAPCFQTVQSPGVKRQVVAVGADGIAGLGRIALVAWRPPLIAMPAFRGVADSSLLAPAVREALIIGTVGDSDRPVIALLLATLLAFVWFAVRRLGWDEMELAPKREREATARTTIAGAADDEAPPRSPDDVTRQTARRTALRR